MAKEVNLDLILGFLEMVYDMKEAFVFRKEHAASWQMQKTISKILIARDLTYEPNRFCRLLESLLGSY
jgi:hypothetical protein